MYMCISIYDEIRNRSMNTSPYGIFHYKGLHKAIKKARHACVCGNKKCMIKYIAYMSNK